jgi:hypothetical protein
LALFKWNAYKAVAALDYFLGDDYWWEVAGFSTCVDAARYVVKHDLLGGLPQKYKRVVDEIFWQARMIEMHRAGYLDGID